MRLLNLIVGISIILVVTNVFSQSQSSFRTVKQPNGISLQVKESGYCCTIMWDETPEGYVVTLGSDGYHHYTSINGKGDMTPIAEKAGIDIPDSRAVKANDPYFKNTVQKKVDEFNDAAQKNREKLKVIIGENGKKLSKKTPGQVSKIATTTNIDIGLLMVEFTDIPHYISEYKPNGYNSLEFESMFFSDDYDEHPEGEVVIGSLKEFYDVQSCGQLVISGGIINEDDDSDGHFDWLDMGNSSNYPTVTGKIWSYLGSDDLPEDAIDAANTLGWNTDYRVIFVIVGGSDEYISMGTAHYGVNNVDGHLGVCVFGERSNLGWHREVPEGPDGSHMAFSHIGTWAHEVGHLFGHGLTAGGSHPSSPGDYSVMDTGYRTGPARKGESPCDLDAFARILQDWVTPTEITSYLLNEPIVYDKDTPDFYRFTSSNPEVSFVIENRQYDNFNGYMPLWWTVGEKGGLLVWRCPNLDSDYGRTLITADNNNESPYQTLPYCSGGDLGDFFPGSSSNHAFTMGSIPNSDYNGIHTFFGITNISSSATTMTASFYPNYWVGTISTNTIWESQK
ncbi:hypothetical protein JXQ31_08960 [candidate division KSB1 bacterium]|nr:hypothetical protein [candidate division KSB1 bacterium]